MIKPKLRFPEFSGEWKEKKFGNFCSIDMGQSPSSKNYTENPNDTILIQGNADLENGKVVPRIFTKEITKTSEPGNIIMTVRAPVGDIAINNYFACIGRGVCSIKGNIFVYYLLENLKERNVWKKLSQGSTFEAINSLDIKNLNVNIPELNEQKKIASFLSQIDRKIVLLETKQKLWETYKKGITQQIFNQKIRFKNKKGEDYPEWEKKKLDDISKFSKGKGISKNDISRDGIDCIRYGELYTIYKEEINEIISKTNLKDDKLVLSDENDIIIPSSGETAIDIATASCIMKSGVAIGGDTTIIQTAENGLFISYYLNHQRSNIARLAQGVSVVHLYSNQLKGLELNIPSIEEQKKIADFLSTIEIKIRQLEKELIINFKFKKGLLQQMFL
ncbi:restriction endonuclease subunit S [Methanobacterium formicicum]|nr:restriction endonuclease subunit S [Methanobacterium formicicum]